MHPFVGAGMASGGSLTTPVGALVVNVTSTAQAVAFPPGTKAGDLAMIMMWEGFSAGGSISGGAGGWTKSALAWVALGYFSAVFYKVLAAGDLAGVVANSTSSAYSLIVATYRGPTGLTVKDTEPDGAGSTLTLAGFTKSAGCKGIVTLVQDRDPSSTPTAPDGFTPRAGPGNFGYFTGSIADLLSIGNYINGEDVVWTDFASATSQVGWLFELT